jgi:vitamin B12 transporter
LVSTHFKTVSKSFEGQFAAAPVAMNGYYTLDIYSEYSFDKKFKVFADFRNITDQQYFEIRGFNSKRFNVNGGIMINL